MKSLVLYDSNYGNTQKIAQIVADELKSTIKHVSEFTKSDLKDIELLIVGSPIIGWQPSEKTNAFLSGLSRDDLKNIKVTAFDTRVKLFIHGDASKKIVTALQASGAELFTNPVWFYVKGKEGPLLDGELERTKEWALTIKSKF